MSMKKYKEKFGRFVTTLYTKWKLPEFTTAMTMSDFDELDRDNKEKYPIRFFLQQTLPIWLHHRKITFINTPYDWVRFRTVSRHHVIKLRDMQPRWADSDNILLMANFQILRDFVEVRMAQTNTEWWDQRRPKGMPEWIWNRVRLNTRSPAAGMDHMRQLAQFFKDENLPPPAAVEQLDLYLWWTEGYLHRVDSWNDSVIWGEDCDSIDYDQMKNGHRCSSMASQLEDLYNDEEQMMLERLVAIRQSLWY
jgi:hypothetical protein